MQAEITHNTIKGYREHRQPPRNFTHLAKHSLKLKNNDKHRTKSCEQTTQTPQKTIVGDTAHRHGASSSRNHSVHDWCSHNPMSPAGSQVPQGPIRPIYHNHS